MKFASVFDATKARFPELDFERKDVGDKESMDLQAKYQLPMPLPIPYLLMLDDKGGIVAVGNPQMDTTPAPPHYDTEKFIKFVDGIK